MKFYKIFLSGLLILNALFFSGCVSSEARGRIVKTWCNGGVAVIDEKFDAGINVEMTIKNEGKAGFLAVEAMLSSSEGSFTRSQDVYFNEDETRNLKFLVHEVTINADNPQCFGKVSPEAQ